MLSRELPHQPRRPHGCYLKLVEIHINVAAEFRLRNRPVLVEDVAVFGSRQYDQGVL